MVARQNTHRTAPRGPAAQRRAGAKADRDGDVVMGLAIKGRTAVGKSTVPPAGPRRETRSTRGGIIGATAQREILRKAGASDVSMKEARVSGARGGLVELKVTGWDKSKASGAADGGVSALMKWLEKKAGMKLGSRTRSVKIRKSRVEGSDLIIKVAPEDVGALVRMNNYGWAGTSIGIMRLGGPAQEPAALSSEAEKTKAMLRAVLERRYDFDTKFLNLSALGQDEELQKQHIFDTSSTANKFFAAMMKVLELSFDSEEERNAAFVSVSLANNDLQGLTAVRDLAYTLPKLQNLDLSNNKFEKLSALDLWRKRFYHLQHIILTGNPFEQNEPDFAQEVIKWYPNLRQLNGIQVRTEDEVSKKTKITELPFPIRSALFQDEGGIAQQFIVNYFAGYDSDRTGLAALYYDDKSEFSYAVDTGAPSDPAGTEKAEKGEWQDYLKDSRNLKKIKQLPARQSRIVSGANAVADALTSLPKTKHPDLASDARKWMIEAKMVSGVPDLTGQSVNGVDGFEINIHGEFLEIDPLSGSAKKNRSFDRTFILGPGGQTGVRIVSDLLTIRGYGGVQAFEPEHADIKQVEAEPAQSAAPIEGPPQLPAGVSVQIAEQMVTEVAKQTGMTVEYSKQCLDQVGWIFEKGLEAFASVRGNLPAEAFMQPPV